MTPSISKHGKQCKQLAYCHYLPSVLWCCWLGDRKDSRPVKTEWWGAGVVVCLKQGADLHTAQLTPLPLTVSCFSEIQTCFTSLVPAHPGSPGKGPLNVCVCVTIMTSDILSESSLVKCFTVTPSRKSFSSSRHCFASRISENFSFKYLRTHTHTRTRQLTCNGRHLQLMLAAMEQWTSAFRQPSPTCRTAFPAQHLRPSGVLSCRPDGLELTPGFYPGSNEQRRLF